MRDESLFLVLLRSRRKIQFVCVRTFHAARFIANYDARNLHFNLLDALAGRRTPHVWYLTCSEFRICCKDIVTCLMRCDAYFGCRDDMMSLTTYILLVVLSYRPLPLKRCAYILLTISICCWVYRAQSCSAKLWLSARHLGNTSHGAGSKRA